MTEKEYKEYIEECDKWVDDFNRIAKRLGVEPTGGDVPINMAFILKLLRAIEQVLDSQTCEDAVSRQAVDEIKELMTDINGDTVYAVRMSDIRQLSSVNPQEPKIDWIPVSERFPEDSELVLFSTKTDRVFEGRFFADNTDRQWYAFRDETFAWNNVVTAWMPLPEPYKASPTVAEEVQDGISN